MSSLAPLATSHDAEAIPLAQVQALRRIALAVAHPGGPSLFADLAGELAASLQVGFVFMAVFADDSRTRMRTLAACLDGRVLRNFDYELEGSPCSQVVGRSCQFIAAGLLPQLKSGSLSAGKGMDSFAAFPLNDSAGDPLGLVVAMDRQPIAGGDADHAEAMLKIIAGRVASEIERERTDEALRAVALAVSASRSGTVFDELVRLLATILHVEVAFIARYEPAQPDSLRMLAMYCDGRILQDISYPLKGTPCETVLGQRFRAYPAGLQAQFPDDRDAREQCTESYAGHPLAALDGTPLGIVSVASRRPLTQLDRTEAMLKIFAVRAAAEIERLRASEALQRSEASYRAIFEASEDAIFIHDWDTGAVLDVNSKACDTYGYSLDELRRSTAADTSSGVFPYTGEEAMRLMELARTGRCPPFEWQRRNKDGSLHWDEVRLKPAMLDGRPHLLAFSREITAQKQALEDLRVREEQYRAIFESSQDGLFMWDDRLHVVDVNPAGVALFGLPREEIVGRGFPRCMPEGYVRERLQLVRRALAGEAIHMETMLLRPDGITFDADLRLMPFVQQGQPHALAVVRDISERRRRERELQRSEARLRATVEAAFDCVISMDSDGRIIQFNAAAERVFGHRREDVLGRLLAEVILPERHRDAHLRGMRNFRAGAKGTMIGRLVETTALRADGSEIPVELAIGVAAVPEGSIFVGHLRDITERRRADQALRDSE
jgi:PAS domain S-box-containing protein